MHLKRYREFILNESRKFNKNTDLIIKKGTELFHSTSEDFDIENARPGGYDKIYWTAEESAISQTYIPVSGATQIISTDSYIKPQKNKHDRDIQIQLGIVYDYTNITFHGGLPANYKIPPIFQEIEKDVETFKKEFRKIRMEKEASEEELTDFMSNSNMSELENDDDKYEEWLDKKIILKIKTIEANKRYFKIDKEWGTRGNADSKKFELINNKLIELGYKPNDNGYDNNHRWNIKLNIRNGKECILPSDYRTQGRLIINVPMEDLLIYDLTNGSNSEGDLTDVDYHRIDLFQKVEKDGYDGIKINDYAQVESEGNFGHTSIGLFESTIKKLHKESIVAEHPENFGEVHYKTGDYESKEYKEYKNSK
jgi:hypothetical protein